MSEIYNGWAYTENEKAKAVSNHESYMKLKNKCFMQDSYNPADEATLKSKLVVELVDIGYENNRYRIVSNPNNLSDDEIALFCDGGNLCFGYRRSGDTVIIYTD